MAVNGIGLGFRYAMAEEILSAELPQLRWLEIHPENYMGRGGRFRYRLDQARERFPLATHGLTLGFGATTPADTDYVTALQGFLHEIGTPFHSEHLCFCGSEGMMLHDLLPLPFTAEAVGHASQQVQALRSRLEVPLAVENVSYYAHPGGAPEMDEAAFIWQVVEAADAHLLLDVNNIWVNSQNHGFDPYAFIDRLPLSRVIQIHVAGPTVQPDGIIIDTHGEAVRQECYDLLEYTLRKTGPKPVLLERDQNFPPFAVLAAEIERLAVIYSRATGEA